MRERERGMAPFWFKVNQFSFQIFLTCLGKTTTLTCKYVAFMYSEPSIEGFFDKTTRLLLTIFVSGKKVA
jgi:hypothetical protein